MKTVPGHKLRIGPLRCMRSLPLAAEAKDNIAKHKTKFSADGKKSRNNR